MAEPNTDETATTGFNYGDDTLALGVMQIVRQRIGLWRQIVGQFALTKGEKQLEDITPRSSRPEEFPGIRSYYPMASKLRGLQVRTNWNVTPIRFDTNDKSVSFVVAEVSNPHPGASVMMFGAPRSYTQSAHIINPDASYFEKWPRKTTRRRGRSVDYTIGRPGSPVMMTTWQTLAGLQHSFHHNPYDHAEIPARAGFKEAVSNVAQKWSTESAKQAFSQASGLAQIPAQTWISGLKIRVFQV